LSWHRTKQNWNAEDVQTLHGIAIVSWIRHNEAKAWIEKQEKDALSESQATAATASAAAAPASATASAAAPTPASATTTTTTPSKYLTRSQRKLIREFADAHFQKCPDLDTSLSNAGYVDCRELIKSKCKY
jgi:hypothetical protein